jgi:hypothetical protein
VTIPATPADDTTPAAKTPPPSTPAVDPDAGSPWLCSRLPQLMIVLDASIVNIALPSAQEDLGITNANRHGW